MVAAVYNDLLKKGIYPEQWKRSYVVWIMKDNGGSRPINLMKIEAKLYDRIINKRITDIMEEGGGWSDEQFGFTKGRNTVGAIEEIVTEIKGNKEMGMHTLIVTLDISNAFNTARYEKIFEVMQRKGICGKLIKIIKQYLEGREIETYGERFEMTAGFSAE